MSRLPRPTRAVLIPAALVAPLLAALFSVASGASDHTGLTGSAAQGAEVPHFCPGTVNTQPGFSYVGDGDSETGDTIIGHPAQDYILGSPGPDCLDGGDNADLPPYADGGPDVLRGAAGNDRIFGGTGDDTLLGEEGNDDLFAGGATDNEAQNLPPSENLLGGPGNDILASKNGEDVMIGGPGYDLCFLGPPGQGSGNDGYKTFGCEEIIPRNPGPEELKSNDDITP